MGAREILDTAGYDFKNEGIMPGSVEYSQSIIDSAEILVEYTTVSCEFNPELFMIQARLLFNSGYFPDVERYIGALLLNMASVIRRLNAMQWYGLAMP